MKRKIVGKQNNSARCLVCGTQNPLSMEARFYETEQGEIVCLFRTKDEHQSYPGRTHGGAVAAVLDETIGRAVNVRGGQTWAVTAELLIRYRKPVPTDAELKAVGRVVKESKRVFEAEGELFLPDGTVAATASGKYVKLPLNQISDREAFSGDQWFLLEESGDPETVDV